jgi:glycosyltransferase involved in cell wall biosynthesis
LHGRPTGWLANAESEARLVEALADALAQAISLSPKELKAMGKAARQHVLENYTREKMCRSTLGVYEELLA